MKAPITPSGSLEGFEIVQVDARPDEVLGDAVGLFAQIGGRRANAEPPDRRLEPPRPVTAGPSRAVAPSRGRTPTQSFK